MQLALDTDIGGKASPGDNDNEQLIALIQNGLPISRRPFAHIAKQLEVDETDIVTRVAALVDKGLIKRFGIVVRHHELGYRENAMVVWDVPDNLVHSIARRIKSYPFITLCYRRARQLPEWPYNLYCMIHGKSRDNVRHHLQKMIGENHWHSYSREVLFSRRRFKQCAANYISPPECR